MLLYLSILGLLLSVLLLYFNAKRFKSSIYLGIFFLLVSVYGLNHHLFIHAPSVSWISIMYVHTTFLSYLTGPMAFFYVRSLVSDNARLGKKDWLHFLPAMIHLLSSLPYIFKPFSYKLQIARAIAADNNFLLRHKANLITELTGAIETMYVSRPLLAMIYTLASIVIWRRYLLQKKKKSIAAQRRVINKWVASFLGFQLFLFLSFASAILISKRPELFFYINTTSLQIIVAVSLVGLILTPFMFPRVLYGLPDFSTERRPLELKKETYQSEESTKVELEKKEVLHPEAEEKIPDPIQLFVGSAQAAEAPQADIQLVINDPVDWSGQATETPQPDIEHLTRNRVDRSVQSAAPRTVSKIQLEDSYIAALDKEVDLFMESHHPYLEPTFNMLKLSHLIDVPAHHLGYLFREYKKMSFNEYRNACRVSYAKNLIEDGLTDKLTLEAIGVQAGFSSRSAFFKSFKKATGLSPSEFTQNTCK